MNLSSTPVQIPQRVLIFSFVYFPRFIGGAEIAVKEITDRMNPREVVFSLISLHQDSDLPTEEKIGQVDVYRVGFVVKTDSFWGPFVLRVNKLLYPFFACRKAIVLHMKNPFHVQWAIMANYSGFAGLLFKYLRPKVKYVLTLQEGDPIAWTLQRVRFVMSIFLTLEVEPPQSVEATNEFSIRVRSTERREMLRLNEEERELLHTTIDL